MFEYILLITEQNYKKIGKINRKLFKEIAENILTEEVVLTYERYMHIIAGHKVDFELYEYILPKLLEKPDYILKDCKNANTAIVIKRVENTNINVVLKLAVSQDKKHTKNSIMTFYRIRDKNVKKLQEKNKTIYKRE